MDIGSEGPVLYKIVYSVAKTMQEPYPELLGKHQDIAGVIKFEEERFFNTLRQGKKLLCDVIEDAKGKKEAAVSGEAAFKLFDTHGLPLAIIKEFCLKQGLVVDEEAFNALMELQRAQSRRSSTLNKEVFIDTGIREKTVFIGYDKCRSEARVLRLMLSDGNDTASVDSSISKAEVILDRSVFYPQQGGQEPDKGRLYTSAMEAEVLYARKVQDAILLEVRVLKGRISKGDTIETSIDKDRRMAIAKNHTATHLLQACLRRVLGEHVQQQGSMVDADRLRFDFTHFKAMTDEELKSAQDMVNLYIKQAIPVHIEEMPIEQARRMGALAFFGDKYGQKVRIIKAGDTSLELCGGTHLENTKEIGLFKIMRESSVASGIRRIEAVTAEKACEWEIEREKIEREKEGALQRKKDDKAKGKILVKRAEALVSDIIAGAEKIENISVIIKCLDSHNMDALKRISDIIKTKISGDCIVFFVSTEGQRALTLLAASKGLVQKGLDSVRVLSDILSPFSGSGGGRPDMAQGGIKELNDKEAFLKGARDILCKKLKGL